MLSKKKAYRLINIHESESPVVFRLLGIQFALGLATSFLVTASYSLFLYNYAITKAPLVYLLAAVILFPINAIYARLDLKLNSKKLLQLTILFAASSMAVLLGLWTFTHIAWLALVLVAWNLMLYMVVGYGYWGLASLLFNVRESRRIFSVIGAGDLPAKIIGYLCVGLLAPMIGIESIMGAAVIFFLLAYFLCKKLFQHSAISWDTFEVEQHHVAHVKVINWWTRLFESKLIQWISALSLISYLVFLLIDFTFLSEIKVRYKSAHELAGFISLFFAAGRMIAIVVKLIFSSRLISRLGLTNTLIITPLLMLFISIVVIVLPIADPFGKTYLYAFGIMAVFSEVLRSSIQEPVFFILFQPLSIHLRLKGHLVAKGYVYPPALMAVGVGLLIWLYFNQTIPIEGILWLVSGLLLVWMLTIPQIKKEYFNSVQHSIKKGFFSGVSLFLHDESVINILLKKTRSGNVRERIHALTLLERSGYEHLDSLYKDLLDCDEKMLQQFLMERIGFYGFVSAKEYIRDLAENCEDEALRKTAFKTLCQVDEAFLQETLKKRDELPASFRQALYVSLAEKAETGSGVPQLHEELEMLASSSREADHLLLLEMMIAEPSLATWNTWKKLINQPLSNHTYNILLQTAGKLEAVELLPEIFEALNSAVFRKSALSALKSMNETLFENQTLLEKLDTAQKKLVASVAATTRTRGAQSYLLRLYDYIAIDDAIVTNALWEQNFQASPQERETMQRQVNRILEELQLKANLWEKTDSGKHLQLSKALYAEIKIDCILLLRLLAMQFGRHQLHRVIELMEMESYSNIPNAIELLEISLPRQLFQELNNTLELLINKPDLKRSNAQPFSKTAKQILSTAHAFTEWTKAVTWYLAGREIDSTLVPELARLHGESPSFIERETKEFVISNFKQT